jgi:hypothetical protein
MSCGLLSGAAPDQLTSSLPRALSTAVPTVLVYLQIEWLRGNFLTPYIQGDMLQVHSLIVLFLITSIATPPLPPRTPGCLARW